MHIAEAETEEKKTGCYRHTEMQRDLIIEKLKEKGLRITRQRKILLDIILEGECSCCKEIYYRASALDPKIGVATVYRMVNTLESIGAISRKNMYRVACSTKGVCTVELDDDTICHLSGQKLNEVILAGLRACRGDPVNRISVPWRCCLFMRSGEYGKTMAQYNRKEEVCTD